MLAQTCLLVTPCPLQIFEQCTSYWVSRWPLSRRQHAPNKSCVVNNDVRLITQFYFPAWITDYVNLWKRDVTIGVTIYYHFTVNCNSLVFVGAVAQMFVMNIINQHGNDCYPPFWWSKLPVVIVCHVLDNEAIDIEVDWEPCHKLVKWWTTEADLAKSHLRSSFVFQLVKNRLKRGLPL